MAFPNHLRLSIHQSTGEHKVSMSLLNTKTGYTTPWHCTVALMADGEWMSGPKGDFEANPNLVIVFENGRPSHFQEISPNTEESEFFESTKPTKNFQVSGRPILVSTHSKSSTEKIFGEATDLAEDEVHHASSPRGSVSLIERGKDTTEIKRT